MSLLSLLKDVITLDVQDFSYLYVPGNLKTTLLIRPDLRKQGIHKRVAVFFWHFWESLSMLRNYVPLTGHEVLFVFNTKNQQQALAPVYRRMPRANIVNAVRNDLPLFFAYLLALPFFPLITCKFLCARGDQRRAFEYVFDVYWFAYGYYLMVRILLRRSATSAVVLANDHVMPLRAFARAAQDEDIPTVYLQHAAVTERFPPLSFDYALLEGRDALNKYVSCGPSLTEVFLVGMPKFDTHRHYINNKNQAETIGICTNPLDTLHEVKTLCDYLLESFPDLNFILRPHPGDKRYESWTRLAQTYGWQFSNGKEEGPFEFLQHIDVIIAGDSSIHLEAVLLNVFPIYYSFGRPKRDSYGFQKNGLVEYFESLETIQIKINELCNHVPSVRIRSRLYNAVVDTMYDGYSTKLACTLINQIADGLQPDLTGWERISTVKEIEAYQPDDATNILKQD